MAIALTANAQRCPNPVSTCSPDPCDNNAQCLRFLNAECQVNRCNGVCTANFFFRGRNVTDRCGVDICDTRDCGPNRQCMEEVYPPTCPQGRPISKCRQYMKVKCVIKKRPLTCNDINCGEGMVCRFRERGSYSPVVRCVPAPVTPTRPTPSIVTITAPTTGSVIVTPGPFTCQVPCPPGTQCTTFPPELELTVTVSGSLCLPAMARSCEELNSNCPDETHGCQIQSLPTHGLSLAVCFPLSQLNNFPHLSCDTVVCAEGSVCVGLRVGSTPVVGSCISTGCTNSTGCNFDSTCTSLPAEFGLNFNSICTPSTFEVQVGIETCAESGRNCSNFKICQEAYIDGTLIGTECNFPPFLASSCEELLSCDTDNDMGCSIVSYESFGSLAMCLPQFAATIKFFQRLLGQP